MQERRQDLTYAENRYRTFKIAHRNREGFLFGILMIGLFFTWALGIGIIGPLHAQGPQLNNPPMLQQTDLSGANQTICLDKSEPSKLQECVLRSNDGTRHH